MLLQPLVLEGSAVLCKPRLIPGLLALAIFCSVTAGSVAASELVLGDKAPPITAARWIRGVPVDQYEAGRIYVIDLWSTWCQPCIAAMPAIRDIELRYADDVSVIAMSVWEFDQQRVPQFVEAKGDTMPRVVALDSVPDGKEPNEGLTAVGFLGTSENASIPKIVIIDRSGRVAWIGQAAGIEEPLSRIVAGTWDIAAYAKIVASEEVDAED